MAHPKIKELREVREELEKLEKETQIEIPKDWFWHKDSLEALKKLEDAMEKEMHKLNSYPNNNSMESLISNLSSLSRKLKEVIEGAKAKDLSVSKLEKAGIEINQVLHRMDYSLKELMKAFDILEQHYADDPFLAKKKILLELGFNYTRYPIITKMLLNNWSIIEEMRGILKDFNAEVRFSYIWGLLPQFYDLIYLGLSKEDIAKLRKEYVGNKSPEKIYQDPHFLDDLHGFMQEVSSQRQTLQYQSIKNLHHVLGSMAMITLGGTVGEHLGKNIVEEAIPYLRTHIRNSKDLEFVYRSLKKIYELKDAGTLPCKTVETLERLNNLIFSKVITFPQAMNDLVQVYPRLPTEARWHVDSYFSGLEGVIGVTITWKQALSGLLYLSKKAPDNFYTVCRTIDLFKSFIGTTLTLREVIDALIELCSAPEDMRDKIFHNGLPAVLPLLGKQVSLDEIIIALQEMAHAAGDESYNLFTSLGELCKKDYFGKTVSWEEVIRDFPKIAHEAQDDSYGALSTVVKLTPFVGKNITWEEIIDNLIQIAKITKGKRNHLFYCVESLGDIINITVSWKQIVKDVPKLAVLEHTAVNIFNQLKPVITRENWDEIIRFMFYIGESKQRTNGLQQIMDGMDPKTHPFFIFLVQYKYKMVLDIMGEYHLLTLLEINYEKELDLFLKIATPLALQDGNLGTLSIIFTPIGKLPLRIKNRFRRYLNQSVSTFQGVDAKFLPALQATDGFENTNIYSFVDLVYVYLKFAQQPDLKAKKLKKALGKLQKEQKKCQRIIGSKRKVENLNEMQRKQLSGSLEGLSETFFEPLLDLYSTSVRSKLERKIEQEFHIGKIKHLKQKINNPNFLNALVILHKLESNRSNLYKFCYNLIQNYLQDQTYPLIRNIWHAFPWNLPENQAWCKSHLKNKWWVKGFVKKYQTSSSDVNKTNVGERIRHHLQEAERILGKLKIHLTEHTLVNIEATYKDLIKEKDEHDKDLLSDLKVQVNALKSLVGQKQAEEKSGEKITIMSEFNPLEVLQMGNYVTGSCLSSNGCNYWSTVVNATEVNKRVLWAKDSDGNVLARLLIAVDDNNRILRFPAYYSSNIDMDRFFNDYIMELAKKCGFGINGDSNKVERIFNNGWYTDGSINIAQEVSYYEERKKERPRMRSAA